MLLFFCCFVLFSQPLWLGIFQKMSAKGSSGNKNKRMEAAA